MRLVDNDFLKLLFTHEHLAFLRHCSQRLNSVVVYVDYYLLLEWMNGWLSLPTTASK